MGPERTRSTNELIIDILYLEGHIGPQRKTLDAEAGTGTEEVNYGRPEGGHEGQENQPDQRQGSSEQNEGSSELDPMDFTGRENRQYDDTDDGSSSSSSSDDEGSHKKRPRVPNPSNRDMVYHDRSNFNDEPSDSPDTGDEN